MNEKGSCVELMSPHLGEAAGKGMGCQVMEPLTGLEAGMETSKSVLTERSRAEARRTGPPDIRGKLYVAKWLQAIGTHHLLNTYHGCGEKGRRKTGMVPYLVKFMSFQFFLVPLLPLRGWRLGHPRDSCEIPEEGPELGTGRPPSWGTVWAAVLVGMGIEVVGFLLSHTRHVT